MLKFGKYAIIIMVDDDEVATGNHHSSFADCQKQHAKPCQAEIGV